MNAKWYLGLILVLIVMSAQAVHPDELAQGEQKAVTRCTVNQENLVCVIVQYKNETYSIAGFLKGEDFYARYVGKQMSGKWVIVWSYGGGI